MYATRTYFCTLFATKIALGGKTNNKLPEHVSQMNHTA